MEKENVSVLEIGSKASFEITLDKELTPYTIRNMQADIGQAWSQPIENIFVNIQC